MSGKAVRETLAALGVVASLVFVGLEIQQSNVQARAAAFQAVGIAQAEFHEAIAFDDRLSVLWAEHNNPDRLQQWTDVDWATYFRSIDCAQVDLSALFSGATGGVDVGR